MKRLFIFTYPKLTFYIIGIIAAYFIFQNPFISDFISSFDNLTYLSIFFGGLLFSAGFTTPIATGFFLSIDPAVNLIYASIIGGAGALIADLGIFSFIRFSFMKEFHKLEKTSLVKHIVNMFKVFPDGIRTILVYFIACVIIASPLPDELAVTLLAGFTRVHGVIFALIGFLGNSIGIYLMLLF
ncbi:hypothetical protein FJZ21_01705 [Candidatus Pacearchaeota archaeon]|nr:hypothetical protein [Candidatus Pacearchaeota archaeon]